MHSRPRLRCAREAARTFMRTLMRTFLHTARHRWSQRLCDWWATHRELLLTNNAYAAAIAAIAAAVATHTTAKDILAALAAGVLAIHRALRRDITGY